MKSKAKAKKTVELKNQPVLKWWSVLYDNDFLSFDEVVARVVQVTGCSMKEATSRCREAEMIGYSVFFQGTLEECKKVCEPLAKIGVKTEVVPENSISSDS